MVQHVELPALGRDVGGDALAQDVLFERHPFHGDVGVLGGELAGQRLHPDHVAVVHGGDGQSCLCDGRGCAQQGSRAQEGAEDVLHGNLPYLALSICPRLAIMFTPSPEPCQGSESGFCTELAGSGSWIRWVALARDRPRRCDPRRDWG